jgi:hypothetical protein
VRQPSTISRNVPNQRSPTLGHDGNVVFGKLCPPALFHLIQIQIDRHESHSALSIQIVIQVIVMRLIESSRIVFQKLFQRKDVTKVRINALQNGERVNNKISTTDLPVGTRCFPQEFE